MTRMKKEDNNGITALMLAASRGNASDVESLLVAGAEINAQDIFGNTALMYAASAGEVRVVELLLVAGADPLTRNRNQASAHDLAKKKGHHAILKLLDYALLRRAAQEGRVEEIRELIVRGVDVNQQLLDGWTPLMLAAVHGHREATSILLISGADAGAQTPKGWTALMMARRNGHAEIEQLLLEWGAEERAEPAS